MKSGISETKTSEIVDGVLLDLLIRSNKMIGIIDDLLVAVQTGQEFTDKNISDIHDNFAVCFNNIVKINELYYHHLKGNSRISNIANIPIDIKLNCYQVISSLFFLEDDQNDISDGNLRYFNIFKNEEMSALLELNESFYRIFTNDKILHFLRGSISDFSNFINIFTTYGELPNLDKDILEKNLELYQPQDRLSICSQIILNNFFNNDFDRKYSSIISKSKGELQISCDKIANFVKLNTLSQELQSFYEFDIDQSKNKAANVFEYREVDDRIVDKGLGDEKTYSSSLTQRLQRSMIAEPKGSINGRDLAYNDHREVPGDGLDSDPIVLYNPRNFQIKEDGTQLFEPQAKKVRFAEAFSFEELNKPKDTSKNMSSKGH